MFDFHIVPGGVIQTILNEDIGNCIANVERTYLAHHAGATINPDSYFLRFPDEPHNRIIALPAAVEGVAGIKWIASFPGNVKQGVPRASAALLLNDRETGYPFACLEGSLISAARTAASAVLGAYHLNERKRSASSIAFIGAGIIARTIFDMFLADDWRFGQIGIHDTDLPSAASFARHVAGKAACAAPLQLGLDAALKADIVVFATNAGTPYVGPPFAFSPGQIVLNISLRDIAPELIVAATNIFDDVEHCMKANTSAHLAEQLTGGREFVNGTLAELITGDIVVDRSLPLIFSPFGLGVLDLALGFHIFQEAKSRQLAIPMPDFFAQTARW